MLHKVPAHEIKKHTRSISDTKQKQVANLQNHIQDIFGSEHHTFLQGSYANDTAISDINDVDIVVIRKKTHSGEHSPHKFPQSIPWGQIFSEIEQKLRNQTKYDWEVSRADKCIEVTTSTFKADVVPAVLVNDDHLTDPIAIYSFEEQREKVNSPRTHQLKSTTKHQLTGENFKPMVRLFKKWLDCTFGEDKPISSYEIESLVHSAPHDCFSNDHVASFILIANHICELLNKSSFSILSVCGTEDVAQKSHPNDWKRLGMKLQESLGCATAAYKADSIAQATLFWDKAFNS